ncbi:MAG TPA: hypothetical protein VIL85_22265 [Thermomicrobiales bacterium]|jgi:hypothetical protein
MSMGERALYALLIEYPPGATLAGRWPYRDLARAQPGYRKRRELHAGDYRRLVDLCLFATDADAAAALARAERLAAAVEGPAARPALELALLVREGDALGGPTELLRRTRAVAPNGGQVCWRDRLYPAAPVTELW